MNGYGFTVDCLCCGGQLEHLANGVAARTEARAVARCVDCHKEWLLTVHLRAGASSLAAERQARHRARRAMLKAAWND